MDHIRSTSDLETVLRDLPAIAPPRDLSGTVLARIAASEGAGDSLPASLPVLRRDWVGWTLGLSAAAVVFVVIRQSGAQFVPAAWAGMGGLSSVVAGDVAPAAVAVTLGLATYVVALLAPLGGARQA